MTVTKLINPSSHLKLMLVSILLGVWADLCQSSDRSGQLPGRDLCAPTGEGLKHCIMEECVLLLWRERERELSLRQHHSRLRRVDHQHEQTALISVTLLAITVSNI